MSLNRATLHLTGTMSLVGKTDIGLETAFDTTSEFGGDGSAAAPMDVLLQSVAACSTMDIISIIRKKRKTVTDFKVEIEGTRAEEHPQVYTHITMKYVLTSPDAEEAELQRAAELSQEQYCSAIAMVKRAGCAVTWSGEVLRPTPGEITAAQEPTASA
jgi:putative redox protein